jgi:hypothetical protein
MAHDCPFAELTDLAAPLMGVVNASSTAAARRAVSTPARNANSTATSVRTSLPTRVIGYAWGDTYVDELLNLALPALLAPGNLPAVAAQVPCELVLVSEERLFAKIAGHPAVREAQKLCPVRLVGLDDLITRSDKYGMALTYALHRAFADLGPAMTDAWLIFFNADFILADGSLRKLLGHLMRGERIVASPSYCTVKEDLIPNLKRRLASNPTTLAIPPREMAKLILQHRHITIRGKTINQNKFHLQQADQFYWQVDDNTLAGQQMPVAIVGMRPQRYLPEPNAFWDHGLMLELCPDAEVKLLGDSDEFLMLELRSGGVAKEQIIPGPADPRDLAERMIIWVTPYQTSFAHRPLALHAGDIPTAAEAAHKELDAFVTKVLSYAPSFPSHIGHPQWDYHWPDFMKIRHAYLSTKLGSRTETRPPPEGILAIDRLWWQLDGTEKAHGRRIDLLTKALEEIDREVAAHAATSFAEAAVNIGGNAPTTSEIFARRSLEANGQSAPSGGASYAIKDLFDRTLADLQDEAEARKAKIRLAIAAAEEQHAAGGSEEHRKARHEYQRLLRLRVKSAGIPIIHWRAGDELKPGLPIELRGLAVRQPVAGSPWFQLPRELPQERLASSGKVSDRSLLRRIALKAYYRVFGCWPRVTMLNPFWACAQPSWAAIRAAKAGGARDALVAAAEPGIFLGALPGKIAYVSPEELSSELLAKALEARQQFDLCVLQLDSDDIPRLSELLATLDPHMRRGATIVGFCINVGPSVGPLTLDSGISRVAITGSAASMRAMRIYVAAFNHIYRGGLFGIGRGLLMLALSMPLVLYANLYEAAVTRKGRLPDPAFRTSVTIIVKEA